MIALALALAAAIPPAPAAATALAERRAIARRVIDQAHLDRTLMTMFEPLSASFALSALGLLSTGEDTKGVVAALTARDPGNRDRLLRILAEEFLVSIRARLPAFLDEASTVYATSFTAQELTEILSFYASGTGAKALNLMPELQRQMTLSSGAIGRVAGEEAGRRAFERIERELLSSEGRIKS